MPRKLNILHNQFLKRIKREDSTLFNYLEEISKILSFGKRFECVYFYEKNIKNLLIIKERLERIPNKEECLNLLEIITKNIFEFSKNLILSFQNKESLTNFLIMKY